MTKKVIVRNGEGILPLTHFNGVFTDELLTDAIKSICEHLQIPVPDVWGNLIGSTKDNYWIELVDCDRDGNEQAATQADASQPVYVPPTDEQLEGMAIEQAISLLEGKGYSVTFPAEAEKPAENATAYLGDSRNTDISQL